MTEETTNRKSKWESSPSPLTNGKRVVVAEVPAALTAGSGGRGSETLGLKGTLEGSLPALPVPPADMQVTAPVLTCWKRGLPSWKGGASVEALAALAAAADVVVAVSAMATDARNPRPF